MSEWGVALIAACSALAGSLITGWFSRSAGERQAAAVRHAGDRQADATLDSVRRTLEEQRVARVLDQRRQTYVRFLGAAESVMLGRRTGQGAAADRAELQRALGAVELEGPPEAARRARTLGGGLQSSSRTLDDLDSARAEFVEAARDALRASGPPG